MDITELKNNIENNNLSSDPLLLKHKGNKFLCQQYINRISEIHNLSKVVIDDLNELDTDDDSLFDQTDTSLYIYDCEKLAAKILPTSKNLIVMCEEIKVDQDIDYIDIPDLVDWQIEDYVAMRLPGLDKAKILWLCSVAKHDIYRLEAECNKLSIFESSMQSVIFDLMTADNAFCDLNALTIFNFTNALIRKDFKTLAAVLHDLAYIDIEGTGLITILSKQFKNIIDIQLNSAASAASLNMNPKQFNAIKYSVGNYSNKQLIKAYEFITSLDYRLKQGEFQFTADNRANNLLFVNYITNNLIAIGNS